MNTPCAARVLSVAAMLMVGAPLVTAQPHPLEWLAGTWCGGSEDRPTLEHWMAPAGGEMQGLGRSLKDGRMASFEFLRIADVEGTLTYLAQPGGRPPTAFAMTGSGPNWARFENPQHDFPTRIEYRREGDALAAEIAGPGRDGSDRRIAFGFERCAAPPAQASGK